MIIERVTIYIIYIYEYVKLSASRFSDLARYKKITGWAIIEELSIRRRLRIFLISWGQKTHVKHCYVDLSSWYEFCSAIICISINIVSDLSTTIWDGFDSLSVNDFLIQQQGITVTDVWKSNVKNIFHIISHVGLSECLGQTTWYSSFHSPCTQPAIGATKHPRQNAYFTAMFGHYIGGYSNNKLRRLSQIDCIAMLIK